MPKLLQDSDNAKSYFQVISLQLPVQNATFLLIFLTISHTGHFAEPEKLHIIHVMRWDIFSQNHAITTIQSH